MCLSPGALPGSGETVHHVLRKPGLFHQGGSTYRGLRLPPAQWVRGDFQGPTQQRPAVTSLRDLPWQPVGGVTGQLPLGQLPLGQLPWGQLPRGQLINPLGQLPPGQLPPEQLPPRTITPVGQLPRGQLPLLVGQLPLRTITPPNPYLWVVVLRGNCPTNRGNCPRGNCPTGVMVLGGSCPGGNCPGGSCPRGVIALRGSRPRGSYPQGSCPRGSCPRGSCPRTGWWPSRYNTPRSGQICFLPLLSNLKKKYSAFDIPRVSIQIFREQTGKEVGRLGVLGNRGMALYVKLLVHFIFRNMGVALFWGENNMPHSTDN